MDCEFSEVMKHLISPILMAESISCAIIGAKGLESRIV
jgi:hypothetical protein